MATNTIAIANLPVLPPNAVSGGDIIPIVDVSDTTDPGGTTKGVTVSALALNIVNVFDVANYTADGGPLPTDGTTSIQAALTAALAAAQNVGGGCVRLPWTSLGYNIGSGSPGILLPSHVILECLVGQLLLTYNGTGFAIDAAGASYSALRNLYISTPNDAASGVRWGGSASIGSFWTWMDNVTVQGSGNVTTTGTSFTLDSNAHFCAYHFGKQVYGLGHKFGLNVIGQNAGSATWTTVTFEMLTLVGRGAGHVTGSIGVQTDVHSNLESSYLRGLVCEGYTVSTSFAAASGCFGFSISGGIESNDTNYPIQPTSFAGEFDDPHGSYYFRQLSNGTVNLWMQDFAQSGVWTTLSHYDRIHIIEQGSALAQKWGVVRAGLANDPTSYREDKFIISMGGTGDFGSTNNWIKFLGKRLAWDSNIPTAGAWDQGSIVFQNVPSGGNGAEPAIWQCVTSGTIKAGLSSNATTTSGSPTVTVDAISVLAAGDYITIVGAYANPTLVKFVNGLTLTMASNASGSVGPVAVVYPAFVFRMLLQTPGFGANRGDANVVLTNTDGPTQRFDTALTANRTITLPAALINQQFRIVRHDSAAFTLTVLNPSAGTIKVMPSATPAWCDVECDYTGTWILTAYGTL